MMKFNKVTMDAKQAFDKYNAPNGYVNTEHNFEMMYIWQEAMDICYGVIDDALVLVTCSKKYKPFFVQPAHLNHDEPVYPLYLKLKEKAQELDFKFSMRGICPGYGKKLREESGNTINFFNDENYYEYVYLTEDLKNLAGKKFSQKRNHINNFLNDFSDAKYLPYDDSMKGEVLNLTESWGSINGFNTDYYNELNALIRAIEHRRELNVDGGVITAQDKIIAFSFGFRAAENMYCVMFEKADAKYRGAYQFINREFARHNIEAKYTNRQEDLGIEGIRHAKRSYNPIFLIEKLGIE